MNKLSKIAVVLGVMGTCICVTLAEEPLTTIPNPFMDSFGSGSSRSDPLLIGSSDGSATMDRTILFAQAGEISSGSEAVVPAETAGGSAVAAKEASTWSDMTAMFRPSRWRHPLTEGGTLSWLNYKTWGAAPGRTAKVLAGEVITLGGLYFILEGLGAFGSSSASGGAAAGGGGEMPF